jgi:hypothetical protein
MNLFEFLQTKTGSIIITIGLIFILTPGVLLRLPFGHSINLDKSIGPAFAEKSDLLTNEEKTSIYVNALVHSLVIFFFIYYLIPYFNLSGYFALVPPPSS